MAEQLMIEPDKAEFKPHVKGKSEHKLKNPSKVRLAFKVKCSNNAVYRVRPVFAIVEPEKDHKLDVIRLPGPPKDDRLVIQFIKIDDNEKDPQKPFKATGQFKDVRLPLHSREEKKEEEKKEEKEEKKEEPEKKEEAGDKKEEKEEEKKEPEKKEETGDKKEENKDDKKP